MPEHAQSQRAAVDRQTNDVDTGFFTGQPNFRQQLASARRGSSFGSPLTITGPSIMFSSTVDAETD